uniref:Uncharacterized protein n=1 Tax=Marseillevirus LCMAC101 TaxID=2506602 RepID=A0A481YS15_9VIRU|nr:MAG: uncharacterized protein LCMAC101_05970 [Marseillevirus LCMAC101]
MSNTKKSKILEMAEDLVRNPTNIEEFDAYNENLAKGLKIYRDLCLSRTLSPEDKLNVIVSYTKSVPDEGLDMMCRWRDMVPHLRGKELEAHIKLLVLLTRSPDLDSHERVVTAVCLYNNSYIMECFKCFSDLACDRSVLVKYRVEATRYLFATEDEDFIQIAQEALIEIIETDGYPSDFRYRIIAGFISKTGINTELNATKLYVPYDEEFVYALQIIFFYNDKTGVRERILSGQHMLQMLCVSQDDKKDIGEILMKLAKDKDVDHRVRADAADVLLREGVGDQVKEAREIINELGFSAVDKKGMGSLLGKAKTIYANAENVHDEEIAESVERFILKIIKETQVKVRPFHEVHQEVGTLIRSKKLESTDRHAAYKALNRVSVDTATFTNYKVTIAEIFVHVWIRIRAYEDGIREELEQRMIEELIDMSDTCSSGHSERFINVLSTVDDTLKIGWDSQIIANMAGRLEARMRDCPDEDLRIRVALGMMQDSDPEDHEAYINFVKEQLIELRQELRKEFVSGKFVTGEVFEDIFDRGTKNWL